MPYLLAGILVIFSAYLGKKVSDKDKIIEEYQKSLQACEAETIGDKIFDKIRERHND